MRGGAVKCAITSINNINFAHIKELYCLDYFQAIAFLSTRLNFNVYSCKKHKISTDKVKHFQEFESIPMQK